MNFDPKGCDILLLKLSSQVALHKGGLSRYQHYVFISNPPQLLLKETQGSSQIYITATTQFRALMDRTHLSGSSIANKHELEGGDV
jgi:hypothetical protein